MTTELLAGDYVRFLQLIIALNNYEKESGGFKSVRTHATNRRIQKTLGGHIVTRYLKVAGHKYAHLRFYSVCADWSHVSARS